MRELSQAEFLVWLQQQRIKRFEQQATNRDLEGLPEPPKRFLWPIHIPQCPDKSTSKIKCRLKADHVERITTQHAGWKRKGKSRIWIIWDSPMSTNHYGAVRNWKKANKVGQVKFVW